MWSETRASVYERAPTLLGGALVTASLMLLVYTILETANYGWGSARTLVLGALALVLLAAFVVRESRIPNPLVPLKIFRSRAIAGANAVQLLTVAGIFGMFFLGVLYLQRVLNYDALETGLAFLPVSTLIGILSLGFSARLSERFGATAVLVPGLALLAIGLVGFARVPVDGSYLADVLPGDDPARDRRRAVLPLAHDPGGVRGAPERVRPRVRAPQHDPAGGRGDRAGGAGNPGRHAHRRPRRRRRVQRLSARRRVPPRVPDRGRAGGHRDGGGAHGAGARSGSRRRAGGGSAAERVEHGGIRRIPRRPEAARVRRRRPPPARAATALRAASGRRPRADRSR